jgi:chromate reductase, NAD(P)H dehydrogenase (quinone)
MDVFIISASPRQNSITSRFTQYLESVFRKQFAGTQTSRIDFDLFDFPAVGKGDVRPEGLSPFQLQLVENWRKADLVVFCSPEYNWTANGEVFIMLDRLGSRRFQELFEDKVFAFCGVSSGRGGRQPAMDMQKVLGKVVSFLGGVSVVSAKILEVHEAEKNLNEQALSNGNPIFETAVEDFVRYSFSLADRWLAGKPGVSS